MEVFYLDLEVTDEDQQCGVNCRTLVAVKSRNCFKTVKQRVMKNFEFAHHIPISPSNTCIGKRCELGRRMYLNIDNTTLYTSDNTNMLCTSCETSNNTEP